MYRPPRRQACSTLQLIQYLSSSLDPKVPTILLGDFNFPSIDWSSLTASTQFGQKEFLSFISTKGFNQFVTFPTRNNNVLDLVFCNEPNLVQFVSEVPTDPIFDHKIVSFSVVCQEIVARHISLRNYAKADFDQINTRLLEVNWSVEFQGMDVNQMYEHLLFRLKEVIDQYVPLRIVKTTLHIHASTKVRKLCRKAHKLYKRYKTTGNQNHYLAYTNARRNALRAKRKENRSHESNVVNSGNMPSFWNFVRSRLTYKSSLPNLVDKDNSVVSDSLAKAKTFNEYFASVFTLDNDITPNWAFPPSTTVVHDVSFHPFITFGKLEKLSNKLSAGPDSVCPLLLKKLSISLAGPMSIIFQNSFNDSLLPQKWLSAIVCPVFKKGNSSLASNYRPISLTSVPCKVMESLIYETIYSHVKEKIVAHQHGFTPKRSTTSHLLEVYNDWALALDQGLNIDVLYIDFAKAFDTVSHSKLLSKLRRFGIVGRLFDWSKAFLSNRLQAVKVDGKLSSPLPVSSGVPQGSVLGPLFFVIFINDLPLVLKNSRYKIFADDFKLYITFQRQSKDAQQLFQSDITSVLQWASENQLLIAESKCAILHLGCNNPRYPYYMGNTKIPTTLTIRDLGIMMSHNAKFTEHLSKIVKAASIQSSLIFRCFKTRNRDFLKRMFTTFVRPKLEYASQIWNPCLKQDIDLLESVQRQFTKRIPSLSNTPYLERLKILELDSLEMRRLKADLCYVYKLFHGLVNSDFNQFFKLKSSVTRGHPLTLIKPKFRRDILRHSFAVRVIDPWNFLPATVVASSKLTSFQTMLEQIDLSKFLRGGAFDVSL